MTAIRRGHPANCLGGTHLHDKADQNTHKLREMSLETFLQEFTALKGKDAQSSYLKSVPAQFMRTHYGSMASHRNALVRKRTAQCCLESPDDYQAALDRLAYLVPVARDAAIALSLVDSALLLLTSSKGKSLLKPIPYLYRSRITTALLNVIAAFRLAVPKEMSLLLSDDCLAAICIFSRALSDDAANLVVQFISPKSKTAMIGELLNSYLQGNSSLRRLAFHIVERSDAEMQEQMVCHILDTIASGRSKLPKEEVCSVLDSAIKAGWLRTDGLQEGLKAAAKLVFNSTREIGIRIDCLMLAAQFAGTALAKETTTFEDMVRFLGRGEPQELLPKLQIAFSSPSDSLAEAAFVAACLRKGFEVIPFEEIIQGEQWLFGLVKKLAQADPDVALATIEGLAAGPRRESFIHSYFRLLRESTADTSQEINLAKFNGQLLRASSFKTQLATFEWLLETKKDKESFWSTILNHAGFAELWQSLAFDTAREGEDAVRQLKTEFIADGFQQGRGSARTFYLEKAKLVLRAINELNAAIPPASSTTQLVVNVRNDLSAFLDQMNIRTFGTPGERVRFDPTKHQDVDGSLEVGEIGVLDAQGYMVGDDSAVFQVLLKAPIRRLRA